MLSTSLSEDTQVLSGLPFAKIETVFAALPVDLKGPAAGRPVAPTATKDAAVWGLSMSRGGHDTTHHHHHAHRGPALAAQRRAATVCVARPDDDVGYKVVGLRTPLSRTR